MFFALDEFMKEFNKNNPGIEVVRDESRYGDKETVYIAQSQAKAAADKGSPTQGVKLSTQ